ncbi:MAG TPA: hypothetical protein VJC16_02070 [Candidatus Nanoarchaeia archaeon]|nr:hypothetical protein [Candidatus Nanoarchaeia archaeon]
MNTKGMAFWYLIEIVAGVFAAGLIVSIALDAGSGELFAKTRMVRDSALLIDALQAVPGNMELRYPDNFSFLRATRFWNLQFRENTASITSPDNPLPAEYPYDAPGIEHEAGDELFFVRNGDELLFRPEPLSKLPCPAGVAPGSREIFMDVRGEGELQAVGRIAALTLRNKGTFPVAASSSLEFEEEVGDAERGLRARAGSGVLIGLRVAGSEGNRTIVYFNGRYRSAAASARLACMLLNALPADERAIVPLGNIPAEMGVLDVPAPAVFIETGIRDAAAIAAGLEQGAEGYYE